VIVVAALLALSVPAAGATWVGDCWGVGLSSEQGRILLQNSGVNYVEIACRVEYMEGPIEQAFANPRHRPWPYYQGYESHRESIDSLIRKADQLGLKVQLNLDPGSTAVSSAFRSRLKRGEKTPDEGSAWLFPNWRTGYTDKQIALYADLFRRSADYCHKTYPGVVRWIQIGNECDYFPAEDYARLVAAVVDKMRGSRAPVEIIADARADVLSRLDAKHMPDIVGFHWLPMFRRSPQTYPPPSQFVAEARKAIAGKKSWRGNRVKVWVDEWNSHYKAQPISSDAGLRHLLATLDDIARSADGSTFVSFVLPGGKDSRASDWSIAWVDGSYLERHYLEMARKVAALTGRKIQAPRDLCLLPSGEFVCPVDKPR
jgi:hypothetical protein